MICLSCKHPMIVVEHQQIELDYCTNCKGVWFDAGELELLMELMKLDSRDQVIRNMLHKPGHRSPHGQRRCPVCRQAMPETAAGEPAIDIDVCPNGHGLWFDGGELHQLLQQLSRKQPAAGSSKQQVVNFLGEVFQYKGED